MLRGMPPPLVAATAVVECQALHTSTPILPLDPAKTWQVREPSFADEFPVSLRHWAGSCFSTMNSLMLLFLAGLTCAGLLHADTKTDPVDFDIARQLIERQRSGEKLTPDEQAYLDKAREARKRAAGKAPTGQRKAPDSLKPLCDMTADDRYEGEDGGLYSGGNNTPPEALAKSAAAALAQIKPIDGKIAFVSISMSNATMEFSYFKRLADADARKSAEVTIVDCAQGGQAMAEWVDPAGSPWQVRKTSGQILDNEAERHQAVRWDQQ